MGSGEKTETKSAGGKETTEIICILDRSGSMEAIRSDAIGSFNRFLADQQKPDDPARLTMVLFDDQYELVHNGVPIRSVPKLSDATFVPRGMTALLDAIGRTLNAVAARLAGMPAGDRPEKVIVAIVTDGQENASREFALPAIREMIRRYTDELHWDFLFLAATADAFSDAERMGIAADSTVQFSPDASGISGVCNCLSEAVSCMRESGRIRSRKKRGSADDGR